MAEDRYVPKAAALVVERFKQLLSVYERVRPGSPGPTQAFEAALRIVFQGEDYATVTEFCAGGADHVFGAGTGAKFVADISEQLEAAHLQTRTVLSAFDGIPASADIVGLAEWMATNPRLTNTHRAALDAGDETVVGALLHMAATGLMQLAAARTKTGRKVKLEQAEKVFALLGRKARQVPGDQGAANQAIWCDAMVATIKPLRR